MDRYMDRNELFFRGGIRKLTDRWEKVGASDGQYFESSICNHLSWIMPHIIIQNVSITFPHPNASSYSFLYLRVLRIYCRWFPSSWREKSQGKHLICIVHIICIIRIRQQCLTECALSQPIEVCKLTIKVTSWFCSRLHLYLASISRFSYRFIIKHDIHV